MKQAEVLVVSTGSPITGFEKAGGRSIESSRIITFYCPDITLGAKPGQFVMVNCGDAVLPRPFSINRVTEEGEMSLYFAVLENGTGSAWLSNRRKGDVVKILGPLGNGFTLEETSHNIILVAGGMGVAPLVFLAGEACKKGIGVVLLYGTPGRDRYPVKRYLPDITLEVATEDGSEGHHGLVTDLLPGYIDSADQVFICGPSGLYRYLLNAGRGLLGDKPVQVSLEVRMACGRGICYGCTVKTKNGSKRVCEHGPVFSFSELVPESIE